MEKKKDMQVDQNQNNEPIRVNRRNTKRRLVFNNDQDQINAKHEAVWDNLLEVKDDQIMKDYFDAFS